MYDVAIIGAGPAGVTAAIYCARYKLKTLLISKDIGGYVGYAVEIGNFPGYTSISGIELAKKYKEQIQKNDIDYKRETAEDIKTDEEGVIIKTNKGAHKAKYLIYTLGTEKRKMSVSGENMNGVYYCATCDAPLALDKEVVVVGGNDSGTSASILISEYASKIIIVEIMDKLPTEPFWVEKINSNEKISVMLSESVKELKGINNAVKQVVLKSGKIIDAEAVFVEIGSIPRIELAKKTGVVIDKYGYIDVDKNQMTNNNRIYAAGDVANSSNYMRQIVVAQGEGAVAAQSVYKRIKEEK